MMDSLRRYVWVVDLIGIMFGAVLAGHAVATRLAPTLPEDRWLPASRIQWEARAPAPAAVDRPIAPLTRAEVLARVRKLGPRCYEIPPGFVDQFAGIHPPDPLIVPETRDGEPVGVRLFRVERNGLLSALGLANGDVVLELNGFPLRNPGALLDAYTEYKAADDAWVWIDRGGCRFRIDYVRAGDATAPRGPGPAACRPSRLNPSP